MESRKLLLIATLLFFTTLNCFSQKEQHFQPQVWLYNHQKVEDNGNQFDQLNYKSRLFFSKKQHWGSSKEINASNHLFVVYKSQADENLISLIGNKRSFFVDGKNITLNDSVRLDGYNETYGELLDVRFGGIENGKIWLNPTMKNSNLFEVILINDKLSLSKANEIRTYLSLKYGVDLIDSKQYGYNDELWWKDMDKSISYNIFGMARIDYFGLNNSKSIHSKDQDLMISKVFAPDNGFKNGEYILFGNNKKNLTFDQRSKLSNKQWLVTTNKERVILDVSVPLNRLNHSDNNFKEYQLILSGNKEQSYEGEVQDSVVLFKQVVFTKEENKKMRLKEYSSDLKFETEKSCLKFQIKISAIGVPTNYDLTIINDEGERVFKSEKIDEAFITENSTSAYYDVQVTYNSKKLTKRFYTDIYELELQGLKKHYNLINGSVDINLQPSPNQLVKWFNEEREIGAGGTITITDDGYYRVEISNEEGCKVEERFYVSNNHLIDDWRVYPNPAKATDEVFVSFSLNSEADIALALYGDNGSLIKTFSVGKVQSKTITLGQLNLSSGVYILVAYINDLPQIQKIIIK